MDKSHFECKRCFNKFYQKIDITRHLGKKHLCTRTAESYQYTDEDIKKLSMERINVNSLDTDNKTDCSKCGKNFCNSMSLKRHLKSYCKKINKETPNTEKNTVLESETSKNISDNVTNNITGDENILIHGDDNIAGNDNIVGDHNTVNNINIHINITKSFDDPWDVSEIDINKKLILLLNSAKFTKTLEKILENEVNLNVLIDKKTGKGMVYNNEKFVNMPVKEIVNSTMYKLYQQLCVFHNEVAGEISEIDTSILNKEIKIVREKYDSFVAKSKVEKNVNELISDIYANKNHVTHNKTHTKVNVNKTETDDDSEDIKIKKGY
jgi:hypothetical protein